MLLMAEKGIKGRICYAIHRYAKANNKYMKHYNKDIECNSVKSSYLIYLDANNLYGWAMYQKLPVNDFEQEENIHKFNQELFNLHSDLPFLPERKNIEKCNKLVCNVHDKNYYRSHKSFKTNIKSWINVLKSTSSNSI